MVHGSRPRALARALLLLTLGSATACGDDGSPASTTSPTEPAPTGATVLACDERGRPTLSAEALAAPVTFEADVAPVLAQSCAFSSCHGSRGAGNHGVYLGSDAAQVKTSLRAPSRTLPAMPLVAPGDPASSFLLRKLDDDFCALPACAGDACGKSMPFGNALLPVTTRDVIHRWIAQGAE